MKHWYAYHSDKVMGHTYLSIKRSGMYIKKLPSQLELNDIIWVVEGDCSRPMNFSLVDCFAFNDVEHPPFLPELSRFKIRVLGSNSLIKAVFPLSKNEPWFNGLYHKYISKPGNNFCLLAENSEILDGFKKVSGLVF